jgi:hypothetical protein
MHPSKWLTDFKILQIFHFGMLPSCCTWIIVITLLSVLTFWHRSFTFNSNKSPTWCNSFSVYYPDVFCSSTCFGRFPTHHQELNDCSGSLWFYLRIVMIAVLCSWLGRPAGHLWNCCILLIDLFESYDEARTCGSQILIMLMISFDDVTLRCDIPVVLVISQN